MPISIEERRFIRHWEEQRQGGRKSYVAIYTFGYFFVIFMIGVALGLFSGLRFVKVPLLTGLAVASLVGAFVVALYQWRRGESKFRKIISRIVEEDQTVGS